MFANHREEDEIYPLTTIEIAEAHCKDQELKVYFKKITIKPKEDAVFILLKTQKCYVRMTNWSFQSLRHRAVSWYHCYLQHPGHSRLKETMRSMMYWKGMRNTIWKYIKSCRCWWINKRHSLKYWHVPPKLVIINLWRAFCVDLVGYYTLKGNDGTSIDCICLTMIDSATSWFEIVELPTLTKLTVPNMGKGKKATCTDYTKVAETFDKLSA